MTIGKSASTALSLPSRKGRVLGAGVLEMRPEPKVTLTHGVISFPAGSGGLGNTNYTSVTFSENVRDASCGHSNL